MTFVGTDVQPGTYKTSDDGQDCYYARLSSLDTSDIIDQRQHHRPHHDPGPADRQGAGNQWWLLMDENRLTT